MSDDPVRARLLRRGFVLEYVTLGWNVAGIIVLTGHGTPLPASPQSRPASGASGLEYPRVLQLAIVNTP